MNFDVIYLLFFLLFEQPFFYLAGVIVCLVVVLVFGNALRDVFSKFSKKGG